MFDSIMFRTNARFPIRIQFISAGTGADVTAWYVNAVMFAASWYMQLEVQRTCQGGKKVHGTNGSTDCIKRNCTDVVCSKQMLIRLTKLCNKEELW